MKWKNDYLTSPADFLNTSSTLWRCTAKVMRNAKSSRPVVFRLFSEPVPGLHLVTRAHLAKKLTS